MTQYDIGDDGKSILNLTINDVKIPRSGFVSLNFSEEIHNILPTCNLEVRMEQEHLKKFLEHGAEIKIKLTSSNKLVREVKFAIEQTKVEELPKYMYKINIDGIVQAPQYYIGDFKQEVFKDKSTVEVFGALKKVKPILKIDPTPDVQTWLRYNTTEKQFVDYLYNFAYKKDDLILIALNAKSELIVTSFNKIREKPPVKYSTYQEDADVRIKSFKQTANFDLFSYKFSPTRDNMIFKIPTCKIVKEVISKKSLFTKKEYDKILPYHPFEVLEDNMNTFDEYTIARRYNQVKRHNLHNYEISMELTSHNDFSEIELLQLIELYEKTEKEAKNSIISEGEYIICRIDFSFDSVNAPVVKVTAMRDFFIKG